MDNQHTPEQPVPSTQPSVITQHSSSKANVFFIVIGAIGLLVVGLTGGYMLQGITQPNHPKAEKQIAQISPSIPEKFSSTTNPSPTITKKHIDGNLYNPSEELSNFPIYPNAIFIKKEQTEPCTKEERSGYSLACDAIIYTWQTRDDFDQVTKWFQDDPLHSGWKCSGGAGSYDGPRNSFGVTSCTNNTLKRGLQINSDEVKTEYVLEIPFKEYKGKFIN